jgi:ankyrin repeat protein
MLKYLIEFIILSLQNCSSSKTPIMSKNLCGLIKNGWELEAIKSVVAEEKLDLNEKDAAGGTPLYWALDGNKEDIALWLIEQKVDSGTEELYAAAQRGCPQAFEKLMALGIAFDEPFAVGKFTPLLAAVSEAPYVIRKNLEVFKNVDGNKVRITDPAEIEKIAGPDRYTYYLKIIKQLLDAGADANYAEPKNNQPGLTFVGDRGGYEIAEMLIKAGAKVNVQDNFGLSPLHWAARKGHFDVVQLYVENGADLNVQEDYGFTPLHEAAENKRDEIVSYLIEKGADRTIGLLKNFDRYEKGDTAEGVARKRGYDRNFLQLFRN